jgi:methylated-DNA-[protein]-cysteine S-methyltransferase
MWPKEQTMMTSAETGTAEHAVLSTRLGDLTIVQDDNRLTGLYFPHHWYMPDPVAFGPRNDRRFTGAASQLEEYLAGTRTVFELPTDARGTGFQLRVWELIAQIPYGRTATYGDLARRLGGEVRAQEVGAAVSRNPLCILIPCHRVIGSTGKLTGYAGGLKRKQELLELERAKTTRLPRARLPATLW